MIGQRIHYERATQKLSRKTVAEHCGFKTENIVSYLERGRSYSPDIWNVKKIADALGISMDLALKPLNAKEYQQYLKIKNSKNYG